jgi:hypothetical protein
MRAINQTQSLPIDINSSFDTRFIKIKCYLLNKERLQCKPKTPIPILPVSFIRKC